MTHLLRATGKKRSEGLRRNRGGRPIRRRLGGEVLERRHLLAGVVLTVNTLADSLDADDALSLREAVRLVNHQGDAQLALGRSLTAGEQTQVTAAGPYGVDDVIDFDPSVLGDDLAILEIQSQLEIRADVRIEGPGRDRLAIDASGSTEIALTPGIDFDFTVIASDLSPDLRLFGSPNPADAPFTVIRYGQGTVTEISDLAVQPKSRQSHARQQRPLARRSLLRCQR